MSIDSTVAEALNAQMGRELEAHLQYLAVSSWFLAEGLPELSRFFRVQADEEHEHAMRILGYLQEIGAPVAIPALHPPKAGFESAEEAVALSLDWEKDVTRHVDELMDQALSRRDHATATFLQWFVSEQVEEVAAMGELLQITRRAGEAHLLLVEDYVARSASSGGDE